MNEFCLRCEGRGELYASGLCAGCDAYRMDGDENGYAVSLAGSSVVFRAVELLSPWNGFPVPVFDTNEGMRVALALDESAPVSPVGFGRIVFHGLTWELVEVTA